MSVARLGSLLGRRSCQRLDVNRQYIAFLEPFFAGTYRPVDFEEVPYSQQIHFILEKTCGLSRTYPFTEANDTDAAATNRCPSAVSIDCPLGSLLRTTFDTHTHFLFVETLPPSSTTIATTKRTTPTTIVATTTSTKMFGKSTIDFAALSALLAANPQYNMSLDYFQGQNHKVLFSDDEARKNASHRLSIRLLTSFIRSIFCSLLLRLCL